MIKTDIPGYTYRTDTVPRSPLSLDDLQLLQSTLLGDEDLVALRRSGDVPAPRVELQVILWSQPYVRDGDF